LFNEFNALKWLPHVQDDLHEMRVQKCEITIAMLCMTNRMQRHPFNAIPKGIT